ncbi:MAG TPA: short-chain dehydrogenase/reductase [Bacteroidales bacterium]|jgi:NAD(P)-dependent dehydrogenase (short-subunit alcohol dehydrogenase family)|nr:short-chain dehydrogenase/reductase [Bacteroidales bacterium]
MKKVVLITGATSGLGLNMAQKLSRNHYIVYASGRNISTHKDLPNLKFIYLDVTKEDVIKSAVDLIISEQGRIDMLINSAGIGIAAAIEEIDTQLVKEAFDINYMGIIRMVQYVIPPMRRAGGGKIINIGSIAGRVGLPFQGIYSSTKFAVEGLSEALRIELKPFGIHVVIIEPGNYRTNVSKNRTIIEPHSDSPYRKRLTNFFELLNKNITKGRKADYVGELILRIAHKKKPRFRYSTGRFYEIITPAIRFFMPSKLFHKILTYFYRI